MTTKKAPASAETLTEAVEMGTTSQATTSTNNSITAAVGRQTVHIATAIQRAVNAD